MQAQAKGVELLYKSSAELPEGFDRIAFDVDASQLSLVIRNLVSNALRATPAGGKVTVSAKIEMRPEENSPRILHFVPVASEEIQYLLKVEVRDTGCGISKV